MKQTKTEEKVAECIDTAADYPIMINACTWDMVTGRTGALSVGVHQCGGGHAARVVQVARFAGVGQPRPPRRPHAVERRAAAAGVVVVQVVDAHLVRPRTRVGRAERSRTTTRLTEQTNNYSCKYMTFSCEQIHKRAMSMFRGKQKLANKRTMDAICRYCCGWGIFDDDTMAWSPRCRSNRECRDEMEVG